MHAARLAAAESRGEYRRKRYARPSWYPQHRAPPALVALLAIVFLLVYLRLVMYFIEDLYQPERRVAGGDKTVWLVIIVCGSVIGILAYLLVGRES